MKNYDMSNEEVKEHTIWQSILWHLLPGILGGATYFLIVDWVNDLGFPSLGALIISGTLILVPFELFVLIYHARKSDQKLFGEVVRYFDPLKFGEYIIWVFAIILITGLITLVLSPVAEHIRTNLFNWIPSELSLNMGLSDDYSKSNLIITYILMLLMVVIIGPTVEELYFRGYLLPRLPKRLKNWGPIFHTSLFAIYHIWTPWLIISRVFGVLPLTIAVKRKRNVYLGIISHCLMNSVDFIIGMVFILNMG